MLGYASGIIVTNKRKVFYKNNKRLWWDTFLNFKPLLEELVGMRKDSIRLEPYMRASEW